MPEPNANTKLVKELLEKQLTHTADISILTNKVNNLERGIQRILFILENDEGTGQDGLVAKVREIERKVHHHEEFKKNFEGKVWGLGIIGGLISGLLIGVIKKILDV